MASIEADALKGMLQVIEHLVDDSAKVGTAALQLVRTRECRPDNDDDWVVFEFDGPPDPAVAPLKP